MKRTELKSKTPLRTTTKLQSKNNLKANTSIKPKTGLKKRKSKRIDIKCANLARAVWRSIGYCENCGRRSGQVQLQGAHIIGTGASPRLCSDLRNGLSLCSHCHRVFTSDPLAFYAFLTTYLPKGRLETLQKLQKATSKVDWHERMEFLLDIQRQVQAKEMTIDEARAYEQ